MGERTQHDPGTFSWADISTTDQAGAKDFYAGLFGWEADDQPVGDEAGTIYSMQRLRAKAVAAISPQPQQQADAGVPPMWNNYVTVASADAAAERASELGATVHAPPFDVLDAGRMAVIQDPQGGFFMVWEAKESIGAELVNEPGALCWNELAAPDLDRAVSFYGDLFGWTFQDLEQSPQPYRVIMNGERSNGGIREPQEGEPPNWSPYFAVEDIDAGLARLEELGGSKLMEPLDIGLAKFAPVRDPQGAMFQLYAGQLDG